MPILRPHVARISSVKFTLAHLYGNVYMSVGVARALADSSDFGLSGSKVYENLRFPALDTEQNMTPPALSSA